MNILPMNPQAPNNLDPKLQETYNKVMGTPTAPPAAAPTPAPAPDVASTPPQAAPPPNQYVQDNLSFQAAIQTQPAPQQGQSVAGVVPPQQNTSPVLKILYVVLAIVFFGVYTFVWIKIFNLPLPF